MTAFVALLLLGVLSNALASEVDFCDVNPLPSTKNTNYLQFTKELADAEYAVDLQFKSLHCCAKGYLSIEWFKDGKPYPWYGDLSSFILYPESANQTVYTSSLKGTDAGNYTCRIHNDTEVIYHTTELKVFERSEGYEEKPLATYRPPAIMTAMVGEETRLFCEAFVGEIHLPDVTSEVKWEKEGNDSINEENVITVHREDKHIVGAYLIFKKVEPSDFGTYTCTISNTDDQEVVLVTRLLEWNNLTSTMCFKGHILILFLFISLVLFMLYLLILVIQCAFAKVEHISDVWNKITKCVLKLPKKKKMSLSFFYSHEDEEFVNKTFLSNPQEHFTLISMKLSPDGSLPKESEVLAKDAQGALVFLSRNLIKDWTKSGITSTLTYLVPALVKTCVVHCEPLPKNCVIPKCLVLPWEPVHAQFFWKSLTLYFLKEMRHLATLEGRETSPFWQTLPRKLAPPRRDLDIPAVHV